MTDKSLKISFCTTCKGRLEHLKRTLPENLKNNAEYPNSEFVVLDYGSDDGLADWIKQNYQKEMESGKIRYARFDASYFKMAHAKNMAHRIATGDVICNLDADNLTTPGFAAQLNRIFSEEPDSVVRVHRNVAERVGDIIKRRTLYFSKVHSIQSGRIENTPETLRIEEGTQGMGGRIAITKENFLRLHGYDESYQGWGGEDDDFFRRAVNAGLDSVPASKTDIGSVIHHTDSERIVNMAPDEQLEARKKLARRTKMNDEPLFYKVARKASHLTRRNAVKESAPSVVNPMGRFGCGSVHINFSEFSLDIEPMMQTFVSEMRKFEQTSSDTHADIPAR